MQSFTLTYASGWKLRFKKHSIGTLLFLEWLEQTQPKYQSQLKFKIRTISSEDDILEDDFQINLELTREEVENLRDYFKSNMPKD